MPLELHATPTVNLSAALSINPRMARGDVATITSRDDLRWAKIWADLWAGLLGRDAISRQSHARSLTVADAAPPKWRQNFTLFRSRTERRKLHDALALFTSSSSPPPVALNFKVTRPGSALAQLGTSTLDVICQFKLPTNSLHLR